MYVNIVINKKEAIYRQLPCQYLYWWLLSCHVNSPYITYITAMPESAWFCNHHSNFFRPLKSHIYTCSVSESLILFYFLFIKCVFCILLYDYNLCFNGSCYNVGLYNYNSIWPNSLRKDDLRFTVTDQHFVNTRG